MKHVVKRHGHKEAFDERKLYASVYSASLNIDHEESIAEKMAGDVTAEIKKWISDRKEVSSHEIKKKAHQLLLKMDHDVALMYETFMDIC